LSALDAFGFGSLRLEASDFAPPDAVIQLGYPLLPRRQNVSIAGVLLPIIHLDDFKTNKRAAARPRDLSDLASLGDDAAS